MKFKSISILIVFMIFVQKADYLFLTGSLTQKHNQRFLKSEKNNRKLSDDFKIEAGGKTANISEINSNINSGVATGVNGYMDYKVGGIHLWKILMFLGFVWMIIIFIVLIVVFYQYNKSDGRKLIGKELENHKHESKIKLQRKLKAVEKKLESLEEKKTDLQEKHTEKTEKLKKEAKDNELSERIVIKRIHKCKNILDGKLAKLDKTIESKKDIKMDLQLDLLAVKEHQSRLEKQLKLRKLMDQFQGGKKPVWEILLGEKTKIHKYLQGKGVDVIRDRSYETLVNQVIDYTRDKYAVDDFLLEKAKSKAMTFRERVMKMPNMKNIITG